MFQGSRGERNSQANSSEFKTIPTQWPPVEHIESLDLLSRFSRAAAIKRRQLNLVNGGQFEWETSRTVRRTGPTHGSENSIQAILHFLLWPSHPSVTEKATSKQTHQCMIYFSSSLIPWIARTDSSQVAGHSRMKRTASSGPSNGRSAVSYFDESGGDPKLSSRCKVLRPKKKPPPPPVRKKSKREISFSQEKKKQMQNNT